MKRNHFLIILFFCLAAVAVAFRPFYATTWAGTASNQMVTRAALLDAVNNGVFTANTTIPNDLRLVTREMAQSYVNIEAITSRSMNQLVPKSLFTAATVYYSQTVTGVCGFNDGFYNWAGWTSSSDALNNYGTGYEGQLFTLYNRPLQVGDEIFSTASGGYPTVFNTAVGGCSESGSYGYWIYSNALNAAVRVTATNTNRQYVLEIVYPSGTTNVTICLTVDIAGSTATVQAVASANVNTDVTINWTYDINGGGAQIGSSFTISNGTNTSSVVNINNGSTINIMTVSIDSFSPTSNGTQNYISGGQCN